MLRRRTRSSLGLSNGNGEPQPLLAAAEPKKRKLVLQQLITDNVHSADHAIPVKISHEVVEVEPVTSASPAPSSNSNEENEHAQHVNESQNESVLSTSSQSAGPLPSEVKSHEPNLNAIISDVVSKFMRDEENKLEKINAKAEEQETRTFLQEWEKAEEEQKEERYQKLQLLLTKSEMYTKYLLERMEQQKLLPDDNRQPDLDNSSNALPPSKKRKVSPKESAADTSLTNSSTKLSQQSQISEADFALSTGCPLLFTGELRPYQMDGLVWLNTMFENGVNGILADEMGLGKTVQCIAAIAHLITMNVRGPFLIVVPLSTLPNWVNEFKRFAPKVPVMLYHGTKSEREVLRRDICKSKEVDGQWWSQPVVCTSYEVAMIDHQYLMSMKWKYLIVDEGHRLKNSQCRLIKALRLYDSTHRLLLTGTPLQNNLSELWSLLNFLLPEVFDDLDSFEYWFKLDCLKMDQQDQLIAEEKKRNVLAMLHKIMTPFILRRLKCDVELNLPPKQEMLVYAPLTKMQREFYEATVNRTITHLLGAEGENELAAQNLIIETADNQRSKRRSTQDKVNYVSQMDVGADDADNLDDWVEHVMDLTACRSKGKKKEKKLRTHVIRLRMQYPMMQLRKCCSHPYLLSQPIDIETGYCKIDEEVINSSGKMLLLDAMLTELKKEGHKVLIFCQMTKMLDLIEDFCHIRQHQYCRLDGSTDLQTRGEQMSLFNSDSEYFLFLLSTRAGGLGINLCGADTVIIYESDWNPQSDMQAQDRAHRIGQTRPVMVYRLICANTIDETIVERAGRKRRLEKMVIHKEKFKTGMTKSYTDLCKAITPSELLELLQSNDHEAVIDVTTRKEVISKRELRALLDRSPLIERWKANRETETVANGETETVANGETETVANGETETIAKKTKSPKLSTASMSRVFKVVDDFA